MISVLKVVATALRFAALISLTCFAVGAVGQPAVASADDSNVATYVHYCSVPKNVGDPCCKLPANDPKQTFGCLMKMDDEPVPKDPRKVVVLKSLSPGVAAAGAVAINVGQ